jgi:hypothetical protein
LLSITQGIPVRGISSQCLTTTSSTWLHGCPWDKILCSTTSRKYFRLEIMRGERRSKREGNTEENERKEAERMHKKLSCDYLPFILSEMKVSSSSE